MSRVLLICRSVTLTGFALAGFTLLLCSLPAGCAKSEQVAPPTASDTNDGTQAPDAETSDALAKADPTADGPPMADRDATDPSEDEGAKLQAADAPKRETFDGKWVFAPSEVVNSTLGLIVDIDMNKDPPVTIVDRSPAMQGWEVESAEVEGKSLQIAFERPDEMIVDLQATLDDSGVGRGNVVYNTAAFQVTQLLPTDLDSLAMVEQKQLNAGAKRLPTQQSGIPAAFFGQLLKVAGEYPDSPMTFDLYSTVFIQANDLDVELDKPEERINNYMASAKRWGERAVTRASLNLALGLAHTDYDARALLAHLDRAVEGFKQEDLYEPFESPLKTTRANIGLRSGDEQLEQEAVDSLRESLKDEPFAPGMALTLAKHLEEKGNDDEALKLYATSVVAPGMRGNEGPVARLWQKKHESLEGLDAYLDDVYRESIYQFADPADADADAKPQEKQQVLLAELFTGATCPPCVAADVALGAVEVTYPQTEVIVIRYHEHIPGPDPMANVDGMARFDYYDSEGTPTIVLNGERLEPSAGLLGSVVGAPIGYEKLRTMIDEQLEHTSDLNIALQANAVDGKLNVNAQAKGFDAEVKTLRLRLCLVEEEIWYPARNGIRIHEMVVRKMIGGAEGISPSEEGKLQLEESVDLGEMKRGLATQIKAVEERGEFTFDERPLDLTQLKLVGFVQDDATKQVLQATVVPVSGEIVFNPPPDEAAAPPAKDKEKSEKENAGKENAKKENTGKENTGKEVTEKEMKEDQSAAPDADAKEKRADEKKADEKANDDNAEVKSDGKPMKKADGDDTAKPDATKPDDAPEKDAKADDTTSAEKTSAEKKPDSPGPPKLPEPPPE